MKNIFGHLAVVLPAVVLQIVLLYPSVARTETCAVVNDYPNMGGDARWEGQCKNGLADGTGIVTWFQNNHVRYMQEYSRENGLIKTEGKSQAVDEVIDRGISFRPLKCSGFGSLRLVTVDVTAPLAIDDGWVVAHVLDRAQKLAWERCPKKASGFGTPPVTFYDNVSVSINVDGKRAVLARSYATAGPPSPSNVTWREYENFLQEGRYAAAKGGFEVTENERTLRERQKEQDEQRLASQQQALAKAARRNQVYAQFGIQQLVSISDLISNPFPYKGTVVGVLTSFDRMVSEHEGLFLKYGFAATPGLYVSSLPSTKFRQYQQVILFVRIQGLHDFSSTQIDSLPHGEYVGEYWCQQQDCREILD